MKVFWHFVVRDFKDSIVMWMIIAVLSLLGLPAMLGLRTEAPAVILGYGYFFFFLIYLSQIWNGVWGRAIPRDYILSLPVSRTSMFWIMWGRSVIGMLPLLVLFLLKDEAVKDFTNTMRISSHLEPLNRFAYYLCCLGVVWMFMAVFSTNQSAQTVLFSSRQRSRYLPWLKYFSWLIVDALFGLLWISAFLGPQNIIMAISMAILAACYYAFRTRIAYVKWMWGTDASGYFRSRSSIS
jgi:hypothetical protein